MDIGVYSIYPAIDLFGVPNIIKSTSVKLDSGVDGIGTVIMQYEHMDAVILHSKISNSKLNCEIQGEKGTLVIDKIHTPEKIEIYYRDGSIENLTVEQKKDVMFYEIQEFISTIKNGKIESDINSHNLSLQVMEVMDEVRTQSGVKFPADFNTK